jgi:hypothetical protein
VDIRDQILRYFDYAGCADDEAVARAVFDEHGLAATVAAAVELAGSGTTSDVSHALLFVRDVTLDDWMPGFSEALPTSGLFDVLRANLYAPNRLIRHNSVYTFGKLCFQENARLLEEALPFYLERDPLELDGLLFELFWLSPDARRRRWSYLQRITTAPAYLTRWAGLNIAIWRFGDAYDRGLVTLERTYERLAADPNEAVRTEAAFCLGKLEQRQRMESPPTHGHLDLLGADAPEVSFTMISLTFGNYLYHVGLDDYDLGLLDEWVRCWQDRPFSTVKVSRNGDKLTAYPNRFHRWRRQQGLAIPSP